MLSRRLHQTVRCRCLRPARSFSHTGTKCEADKESPKEPHSSCPPNTILEGLAYLKNQPPVLALPDDEYPPWLWDLLKPRVLPDDGPGGKAEKVRLRKERKQGIKDQNFMKTQ